MIESAQEYFERNGYFIFDPWQGEGLPPHYVNDIRALASQTKPDDTLPKNYSSGSRIQDAWTQCEAVRELAGLPSIIATLRELVGHEPAPFQTLNFFVGTEQPEHQDTVHFRSYPESLMCGVWIALEDIDEANGPLRYYPGSHRLPEWDLRDVGEGIEPSERSYPRYEAFVQDQIRWNSLEPKELRVKAGTALVWHANLLHGGAPVLDRNRTRLSQVTHYFFSGSDYWWTPLLSALERGHKAYRCPIDVRTGRSIKTAAQERDARDGIGRDYFRAMA